MRYYRMADVREGMKVMGADGAELGTVKGSFGEGYVEVERDERPSWFVPSEVIASINAGTLTVTVTKEQAEAIDWQSGP